MRPRTHVASLLQHQAEKAQTRGEISKPARNTTRRKRHGLRGAGKQKLAKVGNAASRKGTGKRRDDLTGVYGSLDLANRRYRRKVTQVSATEIIQELPKLSPAERRTVRRVLSDLAAKEEDVQLCNQAATEAAMMFDRMEEEAARHPQG